MSRGSSVRFTRWPTYLFDMVSPTDLKLLARGFFRGGILDGFDDVLVAGAATDVAVETVADLFARRIGVACEQLPRCDDHPGRAVSALESVSFPEPFLDRVQFAVLREALDRRN